MSAIKISISIPKSAKRFAEQKARRIQRERGTSKPNVSAYVAELVMRDRAAEVAAKNEPAEVAA